MKKNLAFFGIAIVSTVLTLVFVAIADSVFGLHTIYFVGDIELIAGSFLIGTFLSLMTHRRLVTPGVSPAMFLQAINSLILVGLSLVVCLILLLNNQWGGLESAYLFSIVINLLVVAASTLTIGYITSKTST